MLRCPNHVWTCPWRAFTCSAHILTKTCKFQHYFFILGIVPMEHAKMSQPRLDLSLARFHMFCAHFDKNFQIPPLFLITWNCSLEHAKMSQPRLDLSLARFDMFCAHFDKNLQISTLFLNTWNCSHGTC